MNNTIQKIEGGRAGFAYQEVKNSIASLKKTDEIGLYASYLKRLPSMIHVNGLGQALAFYYTKCQVKQYALIFASINHWLHGQPELKIDRNQHLLESIVEMNSDNYRRITTEVLALLNWMQKFATGMHKDREGGTPHIITDKENAGHE
ncbi:type III-B CRISPR module-associated protein Cmr5 [Paenibacillus sp. IB182496]|uniref:CRISPR type III-B/RAMP module-associated protein Cmr5 n=1 Tax=Paenibacillus sabuli TaxID=2772509 RepID=A0A927GPM1_9BACL|nr:type III-B CRISPR module-associated protein Cmr5 [Paenibacillus sabuli]MBD2843614.1 type III-B CRISPR module-associated protein Cmr5 [Paenibacillus sabuli]